MSGSPEFPKPDFATLWASLPFETKQLIGFLALPREFYSLCTQELQGDVPGTSVVYLDRKGRDDAEKLVEEAEARLTKEIQDALPDLFGNDPCPDHPMGQDPPWATPIVFSTHEAAP